MKNSITDIDNLFEQGLSEVTRAPRKTLSEEQIKAAAAASKSGAGIWLLSHAREMLLCAVSFAVGIGATLLVTHLMGSRNIVPTETAAAITTDTVGTAMVAEDTVAFTGETSADAVETRRAASLQTNPNIASVEPRNGASLQNDSPTAASVKSTSNVSNPKSHVSTPVVVRKTVVQRDTVVINETVTLKDTVYLKDN